MHVLHNWAHFLYCWKLDSTAFEEAMLHTFSCRNSDNMGRNMILFVSKTVLLWNIHPMITQLLPRSPDKTGIILPKRSMFSCVWCRFKKVINDYHFNHLYHQFDFKWHFLNCFLHSGMLLLTPTQSSLIECCDDEESVNDTSVPSWIAFNTHWQAMMFVSRPTPMAVWI